MRLVSARPPDPIPFLTVAGIAARYGCKVEKVLGWIADGTLRAINTARRSDGRPRWKIDPAALAEFESARASKPATPQAVPQRRRPSFKGVKKFF